MIIINICFNPLIHSYFHTFYIFKPYLNYANQDNFFKKYLVSYAVLPIFAHVNNKFITYYRQKYNKKLSYASKKDKNYQGFA